MKTCIERSKELAGLISVPAKQVRRYGRGAKNLLRLAWWLSPEVGAQRTGALACAHRPCT